MVRGKVNTRWYMTLNIDVLWIDEYTVLTSRCRYWLKNWFVGQVSIVLRCNALECCWCFCIGGCCAFDQFSLPTNCIAFAQKREHAVFARDIRIASELSQNFLVQRFVWHFFLSTYISKYRSNLVISSQSTDTFALNGIFI